MRRGFLALFFLGAAVAAHAGSLALVFENDAAVLSGKSSLGTPVADGILIPSSVALAGGNGISAGLVGEKLRHGILVRLDNDLNLALIRLGDEVNDATLQKVFQARSAAVAGFLPPIAGDFQVTRVSTAPFLLKINDQDVDAAPIALKSTLNKSKFKLELISVSTVPIWNINIELKSSPKLSFWKQGRKFGLNDVPTTTFTHAHQIMFKPLKAGESFIVPVEVFFINSQDYSWTFHIKAKKQSMEKVVHVKFN